jgi:hypothetical protein
MPNEAGPTTGLKSATEFVARETGGPGDDTHGAATAFESSGRGPLRCSSILHHRFSPSSHKRSGAVGVVIGASQSITDGSSRPIQDWLFDRSSRGCTAPDATPTNGYRGAPILQRGKNATRYEYDGNTLSLICSPVLSPEEGQPRCSIVTWKTLSVYAEAMQSPPPPVLCHEVGQGSSLDSARLDFPRTLG